MAQLKVLLNWSPTKRKGGVTLEWLPAQLSLYRPSFHTTTSCVAITYSFQTTFLQNLVGSETDGNSAINDKSLLHMYLFVSFCTENSLYTLSLFFFFFFFFFMEFPLCIVWFSILKHTKATFNSLCPKVACYPLSQTLTDPPMEPHEGAPGPRATEEALWEDISPRRSLSAGIIFSVCAWINSELCFISHLLLVIFHHRLSLRRQKLRNRLIKESLKTPGRSHGRNAFEGFFFFCKHSRLVVLLS